MSYFCRSMSEISIEVGSNVGFQETECAETQVGESFGGRVWKKILSFVSHSEENVSVPESLTREHIQTLRPLVEEFLRAPECEKIRTLLPSFSLISLPRANARIKDADVISLYYKIYSLAQRVFSLLPSEERRSLEQATIEAIVASPKLYEKLLQTSYEYALGCIGQGEGRGRSSIVELGAFIKVLFEKAIPVKLKDTLLLSQKGLACVPGEIGNISKIKILDLSENSLHSLTDKIGKLQELRQLNLSHNQLHALPATVAELHSLKMINLSFNPLETFPKELKELEKLQVITIDREQQKKFSKAIARFLTIRKDCKVETIPM